MGDQNQAGDNVLTVTPEVKPSQDVAAATARNETAEAAQPAPSVAPPTNGAVPSEPDGTTQTSPDAKLATTPDITKDQWEKRESELLEKISSLEKKKIDMSLEGARLELKVRAEENEILKARIASLESELAAALTRPGTKNQEMVDNIKKQHDELLVKARGMIFDKTKMVKNQELQIEALNNQVTSLKDVANITKDLLNIRNTEVQHLEERLEAMEEKFRIEKERHQLIVKKIDSGTKMNEELKKEYETQLHLFKELRVKYEERVTALQEENRKLRESTDKPAASTSQ